eukprot:31439-Pelagococcus_subviridis.AAC.36
MRARGDLEGGEAIGQSTRLGERRREDALPTERPDHPRHRPRRVVPQQLSHLLLRPRLVLVVALQRELLLSHRGGVFYVQPARQQIRERHERHEIVDVRVYRPRDAGVLNLEAHVQGLPSRLAAVFVVEVRRSVHLPDARRRERRRVERDHLRVVPSFKATNVGAESKGVRRGVERRRGASGSKKPRDCGRRATNAAPGEKVV